LVRENLKVVAAGWPETDAILPPAVIDNADLYGEIGQSCISIIKYSFFCGRHKATDEEDVSRKRDLK